MLTIEFYPEHLEGGPEQHIQTVNVIDGIGLRAKLFLTDSETATLAAYLNAHRAGTSEKLRIDWSSQWQLLPV